MLAKREAAAKELKKRLAQENKMTRRRLDIIKETNREMAQMSQQIIQLQAENERLKGEIADMQGRVEQAEGIVCTPKSSSGRRSDPGRRPE